MLRSRVTFANVMSVIAVFIALGGASYAAFKLPKNIVGSKQLQKNSVTGAKVKDHSLSASDFGGRLPVGEPGPRGPAGPQGAPGAAGAAGERGPSDAFHAFDNTTGTNSKTIELSLPAGNYVVVASMIANNAETTKYANVLCELRSEQDLSHAGSAAATLEAAPSVSDPYWVTPTAHATFALGAPGGIIGYKCNRFGGGSATVHFNQARITATQVGALH